MHPHAIPRDVKMADEDAMLLDFRSGMRCVGQGGCAQENPVYPIVRVRRYLAAHWIHDVALGKLSLGAAGEKDPGPLKGLVRQHLPEGNVRHSRLYCRLPSVAPC